MRAGAADRIEVDAAFGRQPACQRRDRDAAAPRRTVVAVRRPHLEERVELEGRTGTGVRPCAPAKAEAAPIRGGFYLFGERRPSVRWP